MDSNLSWTKSYSHEIAVKPEVIWELFSDVPTWKFWNAGVQELEIGGPFASGTWFSMTLPDNEVVRSKLIDVSAPLHFVDETMVGETVIQVDHQLDRLPGDRCRVTYTLQAKGPEAADLGEGIAADFPEVLAGLAKHAEERGSK